MATSADSLFESDAAMGPGDRLLPSSARHSGRPEHAAWRAPLGPVRKTIREIGFDLITAGIVVLLFVVYQLWGTGFAEANSQAKLKTQFTRATAPAAPPASTTATSGGGSDNPAFGAAQQSLTGAPEGSAIAHLRIPKLGVDKYVVEGVADADLEQGPGHYPGTPLPGEPGNAAIAGHRTTYGAPFFDLNQLQAGDQIFIATRAGQFLYVVDHSEVVAPNDVSVIGNTSDNRLTLTTCNPRFEATNRLIVVAKLTSLPVTPPSTVAPRVEVRAVNNLGSGDHSAWPDTLLYGLIVVGLWFGVRLWAARRRYWKWIPFVLGTPLCLIPLWFLFENVIRLLPNNI